MITKELMHNIITFCNNYIDNKYIIFTVTKYSKFVDVTINVWTIDNHYMIDKNIGTINSYINNIDDFKKFKEKVLNQLPLMLKQVK